MQKRLVMGALLAVMLVGLSGCPPTQTSQGLWVFTLTSTTGATGSLGTLGLNLQVFGQTQIPDPLPPEAGGTFAGTVTWMLNGETFTLSQITGTIRYAYTGTADSSTTMTGTIRRSSNDGPFKDFGTWTAVKL